MTNKIIYKIKIKIINKINKINFIFIIYFFISLINNYFSTLFQNNYLLLLAGYFIRLFLFIQLFLMVYFLIGLIWNEYGKLGN